jgi:hypothetical protein
LVKSVGRGEQIRRENARREVRGERAVGAEVTGEEDHVVARPEQLCGKLFRLPRSRRLR